MGVEWLTPPHVGEQASELLSDDFIAFTHPLLQARSIQDRDPATAVVNQSIILQLACCLGHALPPHPQHVCDQFLGHAQLIGRQAVQTEQQPAAKLLVH
jgi:hypothetical protein